MNKIGYKQRFFGITVLAILLASMMVSKKIWPEVHRWNTIQELRDHGSSSVTLTSEQRELRPIVDQLKASIGSRKQTFQKWQTIIEMITNGTNSSAVKLKSVQQEHLIETKGYQVSTLPIEITGGTEELLHVAQSLEADSLGVHVFSTRFHVERNTMSDQRVLTATILLRCISK